MPLDYRQLMSDPRVRLFASFVSYTIPKRPQDPLTPTETQGLTSFCLARDQDGGLVERLCPASE